MGVRPATSREPRPHVGASIPLANRPRFCPPRDSNSYGKVADPRQVERAGVCYRVAEQPGHIYRKTSTFNGVENLTFQNPGGYLEV